MQLENVSENAELLKQQVPGLSNVSLALATTLKEARSLLDNLFTICLKKGQEIDLSPDEQNSISVKVTLVKNPELAIQYARVVQLVFQLNYYSKCYKKALKVDLSKNTKKESKRMLKKVEKFRKIVEKQYLSKN